jgi:hypothetical protein
MAQVVAPVKRLAGAIAGHRAERAAGRGTDGQAHGTRDHRAERGACCAGRQGRTAAAQDMILLQRAHGASRRSGNGTRDATCRCVQQG